MSDYNALTDEDRKTLEEILDLTVMPGWKHFLDDFESASRELNTLHGVESEAQLFRNKGKLEVLSILLSYEDTVRRTLDEEVV